MLKKIALVCAAYVVLTACDVSTMGTGTNLQDAGWLLVAKNDAQSEFYIRKAEGVPGNVYWETIRTSQSEFVYQREYDCRNKRYRDLTAAVERTKGLQLGNQNKEWAPISSLIPDSSPAYIADMICSGRIVPIAG
ncbi:hypothetical protein [Ruegeria lacuscaerulensis]|uniref:hypothetical protein n=1 Tax=Ruegeria lacuscaerulensis TaxID=55218 RepID=UPI00147E73C8|nr:hypothetical protein [Ruegeria lacuscaerulensis]